MKKGVLFLIILLVMPLVLGLNATDNAYECLEGKVKNSCSTLGMEDQAFSILALGYDSAIQSECKTALLVNQDTSKCWKKSDCTIRQTALGVLALQYINSDTDAPEEWLLSQTQAPSELTWFLEIDPQDASTCKISYDTTNVSVTIGADKVIASDAGTCLTRARSNYWYSVNPSCLNKKIFVSCDKNFATALLYQKTGSDSNLFYVSSKTQTASASGLTENKVNSLCFQQGGVCNYEGSLWATLALSKNNEISSYLPYLIALAADNEKYNPYAFLYKLNSGVEEYFISLNQQQDARGFWSLSSGYSNYYDTALSLLALQSMSEDYLINAKNWLFENQASDGCWNNNVRDTALILYALEPKTAADNGPDLSYCTAYGKYCLSRTDCSDISGDVLDNFECTSSGEICCSKDLPEQTCTEKAGIKCLTDETCTGNIVPSLDSSTCCINGQCEVFEESACEQAGYYCNNACIGETEATSLDCGTGAALCCAPKKSSSLWWLWLLIFLIILVILGIIFRNQLRIWWFQAKNRFSKGPVTQTRPFIPPAAGRPMSMQRPMPRQFQRPAQPTQRSKSKLDEELEDTLRKLKDMSK